MTREASYRRGSWLDAWRTNARALYHRAYDPLTYHFDRVPLDQRDLNGLTHLVTSRQGLWAVAPGRHARIADGQYFGLTVRDGSFYCFQAHGGLASRVPRGRLLRFDLEGSRIRDVQILRKAMPNGCHQIDFIDGKLYVMDTYANAVQRLDENFATVATHHPVGEADYNCWDAGYAHLNSIVRHRGHVYLLKHNGTTKTGKKSELLRCGPDLEVEDVRELDGGACHNVVFLEDDSFLVCDSAGGRLINGDGPVVEVDDMWTRGLSVGEDTVVVGSSFYGAERRKRRYLPGRIYFYDRSYRLLSRIELPAAPTDVRRLDGRDRALSDGPQLP